MTLKIIGAGLIIACCAGYGFSLAHGCKKQTLALRQLLSTLEYMIHELEYRLTPLPELCAMAGDRGGYTGRIFRNMAEQLKGLSYADAGTCMENVLRQEKHLSKATEEVLRELGRSLGRFSLSGQTAELRSAAEMCNRELRGLEANQENRLRSYRTLGLCAGAALVILFI